MTFTTRPDDYEYGDYFAGYVAKVEGNEIIPFLEKQLIDLQNTTSTIDAQVAAEKHAPYSWTIKELMGHLIDGEKVFGYRLHRIACGDSTPLPGFEHEPFVDILDYDTVTLADLADEFSNLRRANILFLKRLPPEAEERTGTASDSLFTVRSQAYVIGGHVQHHLEILKKRVLDSGAA